LYEQLFFRAQYDELTMLLNRASGYDRLDVQITGGIHQGSAMAVLYFDLDSFKEIKDQYGRAAGDAVLRSVSQRVLQSIRRTDLAARIGGDEFVVLLPGVSDRNEAARVAELIDRTVSEPIEYDSWELCVGSSVGIAIYPDDGKRTRYDDGGRGYVKGKAEARAQPPRSISQRIRLPDPGSPTSSGAHLPQTLTPSLTQTVMAIQPHSNIWLPFMDSND